VKKIHACIAVLAVASMAGLTACTSSGSGGGTSSSPASAAGGSSTSASAPGSSSAGAGTTAFAVNTSQCNDPSSATAKITGDIKLGYSVALSGPVASVQKFVNDGIKARIAMANAAGGVDGHHLAATFKDDAYDPQRAKQNIDQFIQQGYDVLLTTGAGQLATTTGDQNAACIPMLGAQASDPQYENATKYPWTTESLPSSDVEMRVLVSLLKKKFPNGVKLGVAVGQSDSGTNYLDSMQTAIKGTNITIAKTAPTTNPDDAAATLKASGAQVLFVASVATDCLTIPVAAAKAGWKPSLVVEPSACPDPTSIYKPGGSALNGAIVLAWTLQPTDPSFASTAAGAAYNKWVKSVGGSPTNAFTMLGFTNTDITIDALTKAAQSSAGLTRASIMNQARTQSYSPPLFLPGVVWKMTPQAGLSLGIDSFQPLVWSSTTQKFSTYGSVIQGG
jgi:branched-chain amino acid transport system substrate-binding protein